MYGMRLAHTGNAVVYLIYKMCSKQVLVTKVNYLKGFTVPEVDKILEPYAQKSYDKYFDEYLGIAYSLTGEADKEALYDKADKYAIDKLQRDFEQGFQGIEYKLNTVSSSRGDYPFTTMTFGLSKTRFGKMANFAILKVREEGQGAPGKKRPVLFPKLVFLYDENLHGEGKELEDVFEAGVRCSSKTMYPK